MMEQVYTCKLLDNFDNYTSKTIIMESENEGWFTSLLQWIDFIGFKLPHSIIFGNKIPSNNHAYHTFRILKHYILIVRGFQGL